nr:immunoglobulin light chain junction region [Macaca mulatta]MPO12693.1 immunoglobulin light chain junction region [Macaca mulatta]
CAAWDDSLSSYIF